MRAKFIRGQDPKKAMEIGTDPNVWEFLREISEDYQLNPKDDGYLGYVIVFEEGFYDVKKEEGFKEFVRTWPRYKYLLDKLGLEVQDPPRFDETIFTIKNPPK
jgi:hypothetical protein